jgi:XapX domain-containing protein
MRPYLISLAVGLLVGSIYGLLNVRSPAPPVIALIGLFGILIGEQAAPVARRLAEGGSISSLMRTKCAPEVLGPQAAPCPKSDTPGEL